MTCARAARSWAWACSIWVSGLKPLGQGLVQLRFLGAGVDVHQRLARPHRLVVVDMNGDDLAGDLRRDMDDVGIDKGIVGVFILARDQPPDDATGDQEQHDSHQGNPYPGIGEGRLAPGFPAPFVLILRVFRRAVVPANIIGSSITPVHSAKGRVPGLIGPVAVPV